MHDHVFVIDAMAYAMAKYASKVTWQPAAQDASYTHIPFSSCCASKTLPAEFVQRVRAWRPDGDNMASGK